VWLRGFWDSPHSSGYRGTRCGQIASRLYSNFQTGQPPFWELARIASMAVRTTELYSRVIVHGKPRSVSVWHRTTHTLPVDSLKADRGRRCGCRVPRPTTAHGAMQSSNKTQIDLSIRCCFGDCCGHVCCVWRHGAGHTGIPGQPARRRGSASE